MALIDSHAHLSLIAERGLSLNEFFAGWAAVGGSWILDVGTDPADLAARRATVDSVGPRLPVRYSAGAWPSAEVLSDASASLAALASALPADGDLVALGEVGLEYNHPEAPADDQKKFFRDCAALAGERGLPLIVHSREAFDDTFAILRGLRLESPVIIHCFSYSPDEARAFLDLGCYLSFSGAVSFKKNASLREAARLVPDDRLLYETDAPYLCPEPHRGKTNTPLYLSFVVDCLARARGVDAAKIEAIQELNFQRLFPLGRP
jgi:TatD DNase family protein